MRQLFYQIAGSGDIGVARVFDWGVQNHKSLAMMSSETSKEEFLQGQRYRRIEDQNPRPGVGTKLGSRSRERAHTNS